MPEMAKPAGKARKGGNAQPHLGVASEGEHGGVVQAVPVVVGFARPALGLLVFYLLTLRAQLGHDTSDEGGGVFQIPQRLDKALVI